MILTETHTQMVLSLPSFVIASDTRDVIHVDERNAHYEKVVASHSNVDGFLSRPTQTLNNPQKNQNEMAAPNALRDMGCQASAFDIKDAVAGTYASAADGDAAAAAAAGIAVSSGTQADDGEDVEGMSSSVRKFIADTVGVAMVTPGCLLDTKNVTKPPSHAELAAMHAKHSKGDRKGRSGAHTGKSATVGSVLTTGQTSGASGDELVNANGQTMSDFHGHTSHSGNPNSNSQADKSNSGNNAPDMAILGADLAMLGSTSATGAIGNQSGSKANMTSNDSENEGGGGQPHFSAEDSEEIMMAAEIERIMASPMLLKRLQMIERAIQQNANHRQQLDYRDLPDISPLTLLSDRAKNRDTGDALFGGNALGM